MKKTIIFGVFLAAAFCINGRVCAACPSGDLSGDCKVNLDDFAVMASGWLITYDANDLAEFANQWLNGASPASWFWPLQSGQKYTYERSDPLDNTWTVQLMVHSSVFHNSMQYFNAGISNYDNDGTYENMGEVRSTENRDIYFTQSPPMGGGWSIW